MSSHCNMVEFRVHTLLKGATTPSMQSDNPKELENDKEALDVHANMTHSPNAHHLLPSREQTNGHHPSAAFGLTMGITDIVSAVNKFANGRWRLSELGILHYLHQAAT